MPFFKNLPWRCKIYGSREKFNRFINLAARQRDGGFPGVDPGGTNAKPLNRVGGNTVQRANFRPLSEAAFPFATLWDISKT